MNRLAGKVAIVTGAGQGIGEAIARRLSEEGAAVVAAHRSQERGGELVDTLQEAGGEAVYIRTDVTREEDLVNLAQRTLERYGQIDVLCNNAGVGLLRSVVESTEAEYDYIMDVNVRGVFLACKHVLPTMVERSAGTVVNVASVASFVGFRRDAAYCASKGAVLMLTRQMALDYAPRGIRINAVCPGFIETSEFRHFVAQQDDPDAALAEVTAMHPLSRIGTPAEVAGAVAFLAGEDASFVTGAALVVDGGLLVQ